MAGVTEIMSHLKYSYTNLRKSIMSIGATVKKYNLWTAGFEEEEKPEGWFDRPISNQNYTRPETNHRRNRLKKW